MQRNVLCPARRPRGPGRPRCGCGRPGRCCADGVRGQDSFLFDRDVSKTPSGKHAPYRTIKESRPDHATRGFPDRLPHTSSSSDKNIHTSRRASPSSRFPRTTRRTPPPPRSPLAQSCAYVPRGARLSRARRTALLAAAPPARLQASHTFHAVWLSASTGLQSADTKMPVPRRMWIELPS